MVLPGYSQREPDRFEKQVPHAIRAARKALDLDPTLSKPRAILAGYAAFTQDYISAREDFELALERSPNDPEIRVWYGMLLSSLGDSEKSLEQFWRAYRLDPLSAMTNRFVGIGLRTIGQFEDASEYLDLALELGGVNAHYARALEYARAADFDRAETHLRQWALAHGIDPAWADAHVQAIETPGRSMAAVEWINRLEPNHRDIGVATLVEIGEIDLAFSAAESRIAAGNSAFMIRMNEPELEPFRSDPRFRKVARDVGLVEYWDRYGWTGYCTRSERSMECR